MKALAKIYSLTSIKPITRFSRRNSSESLNSRKNPKRVRETDFEVVKAILVLSLQNYFSLEIWSVKYKGTQISSPIWVPNWVPSVFMGPVDLRS